METLNNGTDWRQFRKSTHLASPDLDALKTAGHNLIFTISHCTYETGVNVSGQKMDGVFMYFTDPKIKPLKLNSTNMKILAGFAKANGFNREQSNVIENWQGMTIELFVDSNVKMMGKTVDGVRIRAVQPKLNKQLPMFTFELFEQAKQANATLEIIAQNYTLTNEIAQQYEQYRTKK